MKKTFCFLLLFLTTIACTLSFASPSFDDKASTQVAVVLTATALDQQLKKPTDTQQMNPEPIVEEPSASPIPTPSDNPKDDLGSPSWQDDLSTGKFWSLEDGDAVFGNTTFSHTNGTMQAQSNTTNEGNIWYLTYLTFQDAYLEADFNAPNCSGNDQYGLVFRSPDYTSGNAFYFHVTCDGKYDLRKWTAGGSSMLLNMPSSDKLNQGPGSKNTLGIWSKGPIIRLYINGYFIDEVNDSDLINNGHFGIFINAKQTPGLKVQLDRIGYWIIS